MDSDSDSYFEESSDNEEVAAPLHINVEVNLKESPESPPPGPPSPVPAPPAPILLVNFSPSASYQTTEPILLIFLLGLMCSS